jgi:hypothetical protein
MIQLRYQMVKLVTDQKFHFFKKDTLFIEMTSIIALFLGIQSGVTIIRRVHRQKVSCWRCGTSV